MISGLDQYSGDCRRCDWSNVDATASGDARWLPEATDDRTMPLDGGEDAPEAGNDDGTTDAASDVASEATCSAGLSGCGAGCVDTTRDPGNCGICGHACASSMPNADAVCVAGACTFACRPGYSPCSGGCVDLAGTSNCGACGVTCGGTAPSCSADSDGGVHACACTRASDCPSGYACNALRCTTSCSGTSACNGGCCSGGVCVAGDGGSACGGNGGQCYDCTTNGNNGTACIVGGVRPTCGCNTASDCPPQRTCNQHTCQL
jgi:hypothetical protein